MFGIVNYFLKINIIDNNGLHGSCSGGNGSDDGVGG